jgi:pSer/pThr/pTyr-binding forkhead associated (FHA) protein
VTTTVLRGELRHLLFILELPLGVTTVGSSPDCDVRLPGPSIEPLHACIVAGPRGAMLYDLSKGGTAVNEAPVRGATLLRDRDQLRIGGERFVFVTTFSSQAVGGWSGSAGLHGAAHTNDGEERPSGVYRVASYPRHPECVVVVLHPPGPRDAK